MTGVEALLQDISSLSPFALALVAAAGLVVGIAPSSFPLLSVAIGLTVQQRESRLAGGWRASLRLTAGFALGIALVDAALGALFGLAGFAVLRILASYLALAYLLIAAFTAFAGLALLRVVIVSLPVLQPAAQPAGGFLRSLLLGLPFGLSTCPACTPLLLPVLATAAATGDPALGAALLGMFGIARGIPLVVAGLAARSLVRTDRSARFVVVAERIAAALMFGAAAYFAYQALRYAGWLAP